MVSTPNSDQWLILVISVISRGHWFIGWHVLLVGPLDLDLILQLKPGTHGHCEPSIMRTILQRYPGDFIRLHRRLEQHSPKSQCELEWHRCERRIFCCWISYAPRIKPNLHIDNTGWVKKWCPFKWTNSIIDKILKKVEIVKFITTALKSILKLVKLQSLVAKCCKTRKI